MHLYQIIGLMSLNTDDYITIIIAVVSLYDYSVHVATHYSHISLQIIVHYTIPVYFVTCKYSYHNVRIL